MALIKRLVKGSPLTFAEGDANLDYLESLAKNTGSFATTGSNQFIGNQSITGSVIITSGSNTILYISSSGNVSIGTNTPQAQLNINQTAGTTTKGLFITGDEVYVSGNGDTNRGVRIALGVNRTSNRQLWIGDADAFGSDVLSIFRYQTGASGYAALDSVTGDGLTRLVTVIGTDTSNVGIGYNSNFGPNSSYYTAKLNVLTYNTSTTNLLIKKYGSAIGNFLELVNISNTTLVTIPNSGNLLLGTTVDLGYKLDVSGSARITNGLNVTGSLIAPNITGSLQGTSSWAINALTASYATTASYVQASGVVGLNLSQITTGSITASVGVGSGSFNITSGSNTLLFISSSGNVGIGITNPAYSLDVSGSIRSVYSTGFTTTTSDAGLILRHPNGSEAGIGITSEGAMRIKNNASSPLVLIHSSYQTWFDRFGHSSIQAFTNDFGIYGPSDIQKFRIFTSTGNIVIQNGGTFTDTGYRLNVFDTGSVSGSIYVSGSSNSTLLRLDSPTQTGSLFVSGSGNVGIGTINPLYTLDVSGSTRLSGLYFSGTTLSGYFASIQLNNSTFFKTDTDFSWYTYTGNALRMSLKSTGNLLLNTPTDLGYKLNIFGSGSASGSIYASGSSNSTLLQLDSPAQTGILFVSGSGNIGIGITNPAYSLDVSGSGRFTNGLVVTSSITLVNSGNSNRLISDGSGPNRILAYAGNSGTAYAAFDALSVNINSIINAFYNNSHELLINNPVVETWNGNTAVKNRFNFTGNTTFFSTGSGTSKFIRLYEFWNVPNGSTNYTFLSLEPTISQSGAANGTSRGIYINPTLTAAADWRSIEWNNNSGWGLYGSGSASNYLAGPLSASGGITTPYLASIAADNTSGYFKLYSGSSSTILELGRAGASYIQGYNSSIISMYGSSNTLVGSANVTLILTGSSGGGSGTQITKPFSFNATFPSNWTGGTGYVGYQFNFNDTSFAGSGSKSVFQITQNNSTKFNLDNSGSVSISGSLTVTGSLNAPSITGSLQGTASYALNTAASAGGPAINLFNYYNFI